MISLLRIIIFILIVVPALEIWGLVSVGNIIGAWPTVALVITTGIIGGYLARWQGLQTLRLLQVQLHNNEMPGETLLDGVCILIGGIMLMTPGFFTDFLGLILLIPSTRGIIRTFLKRWFSKWMAQGRIYQVHRRPR